MMLLYQMHSLVRAYLFIMVEWCRSSTFCPSEQQVPVLQNGAPQKTVNFSNAISNLSLNGEKDMVLYCLGSQKI